MARTLPIKLPVKVDFGTSGSWFTFALLGIIPMLLFMVEVTLRRNTAFWWASFLVVGLAFVKWFWFTRAIADEDGIGHYRGRALIWRMGWDDIHSVAVNSKLKGTIFQAKDGCRERLPILLSSDQPFEPLKNDLRRIIERHGLLSSYSRVVPEERKVTPDATKWQTAAAMFTFVTALRLGLAYFFPREVADNIRDLNLIIGVFVLLGLVGVIFGAGKTKDRVMKWRRHWEDNLIQLGPNRSLYRQLTDTAPQVYGVYRYPRIFEELPTDEFEAFEASWPNGSPIFFSSPCELHWGPDGLSFSGGRACTYEVKHELNPVMHEGEVLMTVTDGIQSVVFDPRYLLLVLPDLST